MRYLLRYLLTAFCAVFFQPCFAKNVDLEKANYLYNHLAFHEAIQYYEKIEDSLMPQQLFAQIGDCYRLTGGVAKAAYWYEKAVAVPGCKDEVKLHYAQLLMQLVRYDDAQRWLEEYRKNHPDDVRAANLIAGCKTAYASQTGVKDPAILLGFNTDRSEFAPTLWRGNLVFMADTAVAAKKKTDTWSGNSYYSIYCVSADTAGTCGGEFKRLSAGKELNIKYHTGPSTFAANGNTMYFTRTQYRRQFLNNKPVSGKDGTVRLEVMVASDYNDTETRFSSMAPFQYNNAEYSVSAAAVSPDGSKLVFSSDKPGGKGGSDLYLCLSDQKGGWSEPQSLDNAINTEGEEVYPYFVDNTTLSFSSDGLTGFGGLDIYTTQWNEKDSSFGMAVNVGAPFNSSYDDMSLAMFPGNRKAYFSSNRPAEKGGDNIYYYAKKETPPVVEARPVADVIKVPLSEKNEVKSKMEEEGPLKTNKIYNIKGFYFQVNRYDILPAKMGQLDEVVVLMQQNPEMKIQLLAYADCRGTAAFNLELSEQRAKSIKRFLESKGIDGSRLLCKGLGVEKQVCTPCNTCTDEQLHESRRVDFRVMQMYLDPH